MDKIKNIISRIDYLTPVASTTNKILSVARDQKSKISDLVDLVIYDQAMTANILKICNSAYFGLPRKINSLHQAVNFLGKNQIAELVFMKSISGNLTKPQNGYCLHEGELWKYSVSSAIIARKLGEKKGFKDTSLIFTAALLKDIGKVVLDQYVEDSFKEIIAALLKNDCTFNEAEKKVLGIDHAELGGLVAEKWNFSNEMIHIIKYHHFSEGLQADNEEASIVYLADILCMIMGIGSGADGLAYRMYKDVAENLDFSEEALLDVMVSFMEKFNTVEDLIKISI